MDSLIKDENYVLIQGWMVNQLGLKNNELTIYAIIYGFTQTTGIEFNGSLQYLADWCNGTKQGVLKCLKSLIAKNYIIKSETIKNNVKFCSYKANLEVVTQVTSIKQSLIAIKQSLTGPIKQSLPNNIDNINNKYNINKYTNKQFINSLNSKDLMDYNNPNNLASKDTIDDSETF